MKFVDRKSEQERLRKTLEKEESQLVVIYGRRRIGKSALIKKVLREGADIYFQADETNTPNQIHLLSKAISELFPSFDSATYSGWRALLEAFNYRVSQPCTLCLDEFPYLCKSAPSLPSVIQEFWDNASPRFNLILCGSSQQLMYSEVLDAKSPLYGRADVIMKLQPISVSFIGEAMQLPSAREAIEQYSLWGGVPRYWKLAMDEETAEDALANLLLSPDGTLSDEPTRLLRDDLRDLTLSHSLLATIGYGANRLSEIASRLGKSATELSAPIKRLIDMGYIERETPFGDNPKDSKRSLYKIKDNFMNTYYHYYAPNASLVSIGRVATIRQIIKKDFTAFVGATWETLCRNAVSGNEIDEVVYGVAQRWWGTVYDKQNGQTRLIELDLVALSLDKKHILIGECKWTAADYAERLFAELKEKSANLPIPKSVKHIHTKLFLREKPMDGNFADIYLPEDILTMSSIFL